MVKTKKKRIKNQIVATIQSYTPNTTNEYTLF